MLQLKAEMIRKPENFIDTQDCQIAKIIELPGKEFDGFVKNPLVSRDFITENTDLMYCDKDTSHCLLILGEGRNDGVLVESQGFDYVRYGAYVSHARDYIEREMERAADYFLRDITPDEGTGDISIYLEDIEDYTGAHVTDDSEIACMFYSALQKHPGVGAVEPVDDCLVVTPKTGQSQDAAAGLKLRDVLLLGNMENAYMVHESTDECCAGAEDFAMLTPKGWREHTDLLNATVKEIRSGDQGVEVVLSGIDPQLLMDFAQEAADHIQAESMMGPTM